MFGEGSARQTGYENRATTNGGCPMLSSCSLEGRRSETRYLGTYLPTSINPSWLPIFPSCMFGEAATGSKRPSSIHLMLGPAVASQLRLQCHTTFHRESRWWGLGDWATSM